MRKRVRMTFLRGKNVKGFMGHWSMNYYVENIIDLENNELICSEYTFEKVSGSGHHDIQDPWSAVILNLHPGTT